MSSLKSESPLPTSFWHTVPLHYVPYLLYTGVLYAQTRLAALHLPIVPRPTATRRDRKLHLDGFVHFSFASHTPLLADKHNKGYPHVLLQFDAKIGDSTGAGYLPFNTKLWRHRDAFVPITGADEKEAFLRERRQTGRFPSAELLIPADLPLAPYLVALHAENTEIAKWINEIAPVVNPAFALTVLVSPAHFPQPVAPFEWEPFRAYGRSCTSWRVLAGAIGEAAGPFPSPPNLPFD